MGKEATCLCEWANQSASCKVLIEPPELILSGALCKRVPLSSISGLTVQGDALAFQVEQEQVTLHLGAEAAKRWKKALETPPPTLAHKLGINSESTVLIIGEVESEELQAALNEAHSAVTQSKSPNLVLINAATVVELNAALIRATTFPDKPIWIIYPKGSNSTLPEATVHNTLRSQGFIDTKVASVSAKLTALRFIKRTSGTKKAVTKRGTV